MGLTSGTGLDRWIFVLEIFQSSQVVLQGAAAHEVEQGREYDILQAPLREIEDLVRWTQPENWVLLRVTSHGLSFPSLSETPSVVSNPCKTIPNY